LGDISVKSVNIEIQYVNFSTHTTFSALIIRMQEKKDAQAIRLVALQIYNMRTNVFKNSWARYFRPAYIGVTSSQF
jgi:hypothetical protein